MSIYDDIVVGTCKDAHPSTGDRCVLPDTHTIASDAQERQHRSENGLRWPRLSVLDPSEGFNEFVTYRM